MSIIHKLKPLAVGLLLSIALGACNEDASSDTSSTTPEQKEKVLVDKLDLNYFKITEGSPSPNFDRYQVVGSESAKTETRGYAPSNGDIAFGEQQAEDYFEDTIFVYGNHFQSSEPLMDIKSQGSKLVFEMPDKVSGEIQQYTIEYTPFNISGHSVEDSKKAKQQNKGLTTFFNELSEIPETLSFPEGSLCFIKTYEVASIPLFTHKNIDFQPRFTSSLEDWEDRIVSEKGQYQFAENSKVGSNNTQDARRLVYASNDDTPNHYSAITHGESYVDTHYIPAKKQSLANANPNQGLVNCETVNDVAADFLEEQIVKYYS